MSRSFLFSWLMVGATVLLTVYGQIVLKWQVGLAGPLPETTAGKMAYLLSALFNPWIVSGLAAAFAAALCWIMALGRLPLSHAYPFTALSIVLVVLAGATLFSESVSLMQWLGITLVVLGIVLVSFR
ncbi:MAG: SMR family transporter [Pseudoxanthomonas sp.]